MQDTTGALIVEGFLALYDQDRGKFRLASERGRRMSLAFSNPSSRRIPLRIDHDGSDEVSEVGSVYALEHVRGRGLYARAIVDRMSFLRILGDLAASRVDCLTASKVARTMVALFPALSMSSCGDTLLHVALVGVGQRKGTLLECRPAPTGLTEALPISQDWGHEGEPSSELYSKLLLALLRHKQMPGAASQRKLFEDARILNRSVKDLIQASMSTTSYRQHNRDKGRQKPRPGPPGRDNSLVCKLLEILLDQQQRSQDRGLDDEVENETGQEETQRRGRDGDWQVRSETQSRCAEGSPSPKRPRLARSKNDYDRESDPVMAKLLEIQAAVTRPVSAQRPNSPTASRGTRGGERESYLDELNRVLSSVRRDFSSAAGSEEEIKRSQSNMQKVDTLASKVKELDDKLASISQRITSTVEEGGRGLRPSTSSSPPTRSSDEPGSHKAAEALAGSDKRGQGTVVQACLLTQATDGQEGTKTGGLYGQSFDLGASKAPAASSPGGSLKKGADH